MSFEVGQTAGGYEFVEVLENSRIGRAYKVRNLHADRFEVLRVLPKELNSEDVDRFLREIKVHGRMSHPNIVSFYTATEIDGELVTTSEFYDGATLQQRLEAGPMPLLETVMCMSQVLSALSYAHQLGVIHREVSPANILLGPDGTVKLTGFGLAKSANDPELTQAGMVMGWLEYISPEQVNGVAKPDGRSDIYSAGAVLYEMITGRVPFVCKSQFDLMMAHVSTKPSLPASLDPSLANLILIALAKDPAERFQSARQFRDTLESLVVIPSAAAMEEAPHQTPPPPPAALEWGLQKLVLTGVVTFLVMLAIFLFFFKVSRL